jgi:hypothetical protein
VIEADLNTLCKPALLLSYSLRLFFIESYDYGLAKVYTRDSRLE